MLKVDSLIFDLDGTLWDSTDAIIETWGIVLKDYPQIDKVVTSDDMAANFGLPVEVIAANMFPDQTKEMQKELMDACCAGENVYLAEHGGKLFPKLEETLKALSEHIPLFVVSNCQAGYIESFYEGNKTGHFFKDCECIGVTGKPKGENIKLIMERNGLKSPAYVGDTQGDKDAADVAGIPFIFARYGFGSVDRYDEVIDSFAQLLDVIE